MIEIDIQLQKNSDYRQGIERLKLLAEELGGKLHDH